MAKVIHEIDYAADTVVILRNRLTSFAVWDTLEVREDANALYPNQETVDTPPIHRIPLGNNVKELTGSPTSPYICSLLLQERLYKKGALA
jgi:hypothetical protein